MKDNTRSFRKIRVGILLAFVVLLLAGAGIGFGTQAWNGRLAGTQAMAAGVDGAEKQTEKRMAQFPVRKEANDFTDATAGSLLQVAVYKISQNNLQSEAESSEETFDVISTHALAQEAMEVLEQETLQLMASPAGSVWGGRIKVYAGETPLIITEEDKEVLLRIVEAEATCEDIKGRMLVANVILNRVVSEDFPNSIAEVVFQNNGETYQFAPIKDGRYWTVKVSDETIEAVDRVLAGEDYSKGALYFAARRMANKKAMRWFDSSLQYLFRHGVHEFFTEK